MENDVLNLSDLNTGEEAEVLRISSDSKIRRRLMDMGIIRGTKIKIEGKAPMGDPIEISLRGYNLSLRKKEAKDVLITR